MDTYLRGKEAMEKVEDLADCIERLYQDDIDFIAAKKIIVRAWWDGIAVKAGLE